MEVRDAVAARRSVRGFLDKAVDLDLVRRLVVESARAPSGGNLQPWHVDLVAADAMVRLKAIMRARLAEPFEAAEYDIYPRELVAPYRDRRFANGMALYEAMGIAREDASARSAQFARNFDFFGAPVALFVTLDRRMGPPQWSDLGMFLQTFMLLATEHGLATCAQEYWSLLHGAVRDFVHAPESEMLFCGMAIGYADTAAPVNALHSDRFPVDQFATWV